MQPLHMRPAGFRSRHQHGLLPLSKYVAGMVFWMNRERAGGGGCERLSGRISDDPITWIEKAVLIRPDFVNFKKPSYATDSEMTDEDIIVRYAGEDVIAFTVLHASSRLKNTA